MIKIKAKKVATKDGRRIVVEKIEALKKSELPEKYIDGQPRCYLDRDGELYIRVHGSSRLLLKGVNYTKEQIDEFVKDIELCGARLKEINDQIIKENEGWEGDLTICI